MWETVSTKKKIIAFFLIIASLFGLLAVASWANPIVHFPDPVLDRIIREKISRPDGFIFKNDLLQIESIHAANSEIQDITGIGAISRLKVIDLEGNQIENITQLKSLYQLVEVNLRNNNISDIKSLRNAKQVRYLDLHGNNVTNIDALAAMKNLEYLNLRDNDIENIDALSDLILLNYLNLHSNSNIESILPLTKLVNLETLILRNVPVGNNIIALKDMTSLVTLNLRNSQLNDITILADLMAAGALQDKPEQGYHADINLLENDGLINHDTDPVRSLRPYWQNITTRFPLVLPFAHQSLSAPEFSHESGFYDSEFYLTLEHEEPGVKIFYTTDGSKPDLESTQYIEPVLIRDRTGEENKLSIIKTSESWVEPIGSVFKGTVLRAIAVTDEGEESNVISRSFFVSEKAQERYTLPVISLIIDENYLFDKELGIYTIENASNRGLFWERPAHIEFFEPDGSIGFRQNMGLRIHGGATRGYRQKSLRIYARHDYDINDLFNYNVFADESIPETDEHFIEYKSLILRNGGNDYGSTLIRDAFMQSLIEQCDDLDTQKFRPAILFMNGEYWGIHIIRERYDEYYLSNKYSVEKNEIALMTGRQSLKFGSINDRNDFIYLREYIAENDLSYQENYENVIRDMCIDNFIIYYTAQIFFGNTDWPHGNIDYWRLRPGFDHNTLDNRWRWLLFDTDFGFGRYGEVESELRDEFRKKYGPIAGPDGHTLHWATSEINYRHGSDWPNIMIRGLLDNEDFKHQFINTMSDYLNSYFSTDRVLTKLNEIVSILEPEMQEHLDRWQTMNGELDHWKQNLNVIERFAQERPDNVRRHYQEYFDLEEQVEVAINIDFEQGYVSLNSIDIDYDTPGLWQDGVWSGLYFKGIPLKLTAYPRPGYVFAGWENSLESSDTIELLPESDIIVKPLFIKE